MDIYLSINNREKVIKLPVLPEEFNITSPQNNEVFNACAGELNLIGELGLKSISWTSFFPCKEVKYSKENKLLGWELVNELEELRKRKLPFRLIITDTPINMAVTIDSFEYGLKAGPEHVRYTIELKEFRV